jgi:GTPase SAR1 family protein
MEVSAKINLNVDKLFEAIADKLPKIAAKKRENIDLTDVATPAEGSNCQSC